jgi:hypothetical protein
MSRRRGYLFGGGAQRQQMALVTLSSRLVESAHELIALPIGFLPQSRMWAMVDVSRSILVDRYNVAGCRYRPGFDRVVAHQRCSLGLSMRFSWSKFDRCAASDYPVSYQRPTSIEAVGYDRCERSGTEVKGGRRKSDAGKRE